MIIKNDRLKVEKFTISDAFFWSKIDSNPKVRHFVDGKKLTYSQSVAYIKKIFLHMKIVVLVDI